MTWLLQAANDVSISSLSELAQKMMESEDWPGDLGFSSRHLANKLGHANAGKDPGWWRKAGSSALPVLATVLGWTESELRQAMDEAFTPSASSRKLWNFDLFPGLRPLDLVEEGPFPAIPYQLCYPDGPYGQRTWWVAPSGAGRTLLGRWLAEGRGWTFLEADTWEEVRSRLPQQGRCYIELHTADDMERQDMEAVPTDLKICVAAPFDPREVWADDDPDSGDVLSRALLGNRRRARRRWMPTENSGLSWDFRETGDSESWYPSMLDWIDRRLDPNGRLDMLALRGHEVAVSVIEGLTSPGEVLGFLGLLDQFGIDAILGERSELEMGRLLRFWTKASLERDDERVHPVRPLLRDHGADIIQQLVVERVRRSLPLTLGRDQWESLVPSDYTPRLDRAELQRLLAHGTEEALTIARRMLQPGAAEIIAGLEACRVLVEQEQGTLGLRPSWLETLLVTQARELLVREGPRGLGAALLNPEVSEAVINALRDQWGAGDFSPAWEVLEALDSAQPELAVAVSGVFLSLGEHLTEGGAIPLDLLRRAWAVQQSLLVKPWHSHPPFPLVLPAGSGSNASHDMVTAWWFQAQRISLELFEAGDPLPASSLSPWAGLAMDSEEGAACLESLRGHWPMLRSGEQSLVLATMGGALLDHLGVLRQYGSTLKLQHPDLLVLAAGGRDLGLQEEDLKEILQLQFGLDTLDAVCRRRGVALEKVLSWCWTRWIREPFNGPPWSWPRNSGQPGMGAAEAEKIWRSLPAELITTEVAKALVSRMQYQDTTGLSWLTVEIWKRLIEAWSQHETARQSGEQLWTHAPREVAEWAVRAGKLDSKSWTSIRKLWEVHPEMMLRLIDELDQAGEGWRSSSESEPAAIHNLLSSVQVGGPIPELMERVGRWLVELPGRGIDIARLHHWLLGRVRARDPHWREAYRILIESGALTS